MAWIAALICACVPAVLLGGQEPGVVLKSETRAVEIHVAVKDQAGLPIHGLGKEDFAVFDNGKPRAIQFFSADTTDPVFAAAEAAPGKPPGAPDRLTAIVLDGLNTEFSDQSYMRDQALLAVQSMPLHESVAVLGLAPGLALQNFTRDRERVLAAVAAFRPNLPPYPMKRRIQVTLAALKTLSDRMKPSPGRKSIIWMSGSFPDVVAYDRIIQRTLNQINASNVALYPIDVRGLTVGSGAANLQTMERFADSTGGEAYYNRNDVAAGVERAIEDARSTYVLGFYIAEGSRDSVFHQLKVQVDRAGAVLRYRRGYANQ